MTKQPTKQTAQAAFQAKQTEALRRLALLTEQVKNYGKGETINWAHVGSMGHTVDLLGQAGHACGVAELTER